MAKKDHTVRRRLAGAYVSSALSIALVLLLVGVAALLGVNARAVSDWIRENMQVEVLLRESVTEKQAEDYRAGVVGLPYVRSARIITREQGLEELKAVLGEDFLEVFESTSVPLSLELTLDAGYVNSDSLAVVSAALSESPLVDSVESRSMLVDSLNSNIGRLTAALAVLTLLLLFISVVLISNTVRLNVYARRFTVRTMQLVGASNGFIRRPFMKDALVLGLVSALITVAVLGAAIWFAWKSFPQMMGVLTPAGLGTVAGIIILAGTGICCLSTRAVVDHLLTIDKDKLYY